MKERREALNSLYKTAESVRSPELLIYLTALVTELVHIYEKSPQGRQSQVRTNEINHL